MVARGWGGRVVGGRGRMGSLWQGVGAGRQLESGTIGALELLDDAFEAEGLDGVGPEFGELAIGLDGLGAGAGLLGDNGEVEPGWGEARVLADGVGERLPGVAAASSLLLGNPETVERFGIARRKPQGAAETLVGLVPLAESQLGLAQFEPTFEGPRGQSDIGAERVHGAGWIALFGP